MSYQHAPPWPPRGNTRERIPSESRTSSGEVGSSRHNLSNSSRELSSPPMPKGKGKLPEERPRPTSTTPPWPPRGNIRNRIPIELRTSSGEVGSSRHELRNSSREVSSPPKPKGAGRLSEGSHAGSRTSSRSAPPRRPQT